MNGQEVAGFRNHVTSGSTVKTAFTIDKGCSVKLSLVSYKAAGPTFTPATLSQQTVFDYVTKTFSAGKHSEQITVPGFFSVTSYAATSNST